VVGEICAVLFGSGGSFIPFAIFFFFWMKGLSQIGCVYSLWHMHLCESYILHVFSSDKNTEPNS
jgi:hypothetical protein